MADFSIPITVPDEKLADLVEGLRDYFGKKPDGSDYTPAELKDLFAGEVRRKLGVHYKRWIDKQAASVDLGAT